MNRDEYQEMKQTGGLVSDADLQSEEASRIEIEEVQEDQDDEQREVDTLTDEQEDASDESEDLEEDELPPLNEKEKTAFQKRLEREQAKIREKIEAEMRDQYEQQYGKHKQVLESLGGDPDAILQRIQENKMLTEAQRLADANGWDEEQTQWYIREQRNQMDQQRRDKELQELRVQVSINKLRDNPDYAGIGSMERDIVAKIERTNGALSVEEAYWALGGPKRAEQIRLEAQVREQTKRAQKPRTVLTDSPSSTTGDKPLPADVMKDAERMGISASEARRLMSNEPAKDLADWRAKRKQAK